MYDQEFERERRIRASQVRDVERARRLVVDRDKNLIIARRFWSNIALTLAGVNSPEETGEIIQDTLLRTALTLKEQGVETRFYGAKYDLGNGFETWSSEHLLVSSRQGESTGLILPPLVTRTTGAGEIQTFLLDSTELDRNPS